MPCSTKAAIPGKRAASFLRLSPLLLLAVALVALVAFAMPGAQPAQAQSYNNALPPYDPNTPAKEVTIHVVGEALQVGLRRTKIGRYSAGYLKALDYVGQPHHVQVGVFAASGTTIPNLHCTRAMRLETTNRHTWFTPSRTEQVNARAPFGPPALLLMAGSMAIVRGLPKQCGHTQIPF